MIAKCEEETKTREACQLDVDKTKLALSNAECAANTQILTNERLEQSHTTSVKANQARLEQSQQKANEAHQLFLNANVIKNETDRSATVHMLAIFDNLWRKQKIAFEETSGEFADKYAVVKDMKRDMELFAAHTHSSQQKFIIVLDWYAQKKQVSEVSLDPDKFLDSFWHLIIRTASGNRLATPGMIKDATTIAQAIQPPYRIFFEHDPASDVTYDVQYKNHQKELKDRVFQHIESELDAVTDLDVIELKASRLACKRTQVALFEAKERVRELQNRGLGDQCEMLEGSIATMTVDVHRLEDQVTAAKGKFQHLGKLVDRIILDWESILSECVIKRQLQAIENMMDSQAEIMREKVTPFVTHVHANAHTNYGSLGSGLLKSGGDANELRTEIPQIQADYASVISE